MVSISVAMATFNGERFLEEQLASLRAQTLLPAELVVCDDDSSDRTQAIVEDFARSAPFPVRWMRNGTRLGYRHNFMKAAGETRGDIIAFCDQDDLWAPDKLLTSSAPLEDPRVLMTYHAIELIDADGRRLGPYEERVPPVNPLTDRDFYPWLFGLGFTLTFRAELKALTPLWPSSADFHHVDRRPLAHDQWFFFLAARLGHIVYIDEPLARYRQHGDNVFGVQARAPRPTTYRGRIEERHRRYSGNEAYCRQSVEILAEVAHLWAPDARARIAAGSEHYRSLERYIALSARLIGHPRLWRRLDAVRQLWASGYYDGTIAIPFDRRPISRDILTSVVSTVMGTTDTRPTGVAATNGLSPVDASERTERPRVGETAGKRRLRKPSLRGL